jgi:hypothetical protein
MPQKCIARHGVISALCAIADLKIGVEDDAVAGGCRIALLSVETGQERRMSHESARSETDADEASM